ncbi:competence/damage-inducible protein A [Clostridium luticellarii]|jgi:nicotinamide-nucleotide amidase|uniref:Putative competence-damage inducible protein n=1 Tax=Clostridium luticellarii TaxID=1691940 RepID=A0A2T0BSH2_9CLOT|nr:competence/damage-inducible protein A [Clostridium luticellarii]MCI1946504.1 competence/damage-inducible protein A [Clostridium luticellarii]MCI1969705.1 competence/damage-inducible protein A [Clostridium luticellarii]MCI1996372.1 competence/damage-inducible protein A [Clostridium luticellarii]MCI2040701.1 competence/damage-inducible protein A [Clostridium luticellarii]PRR86817.1 putative competence-damage inducible protein [Clostridium luticellarii]
MKAEILCVGTEILLGDIVNTNAQFISRQLANLGIEVFHQSVVGDNPDRLLEELENGFKRSDIIITTGGLGPTPDDLTKETGAKFFNRELILDKNSLENLKEHFSKMGRSYSKGNNIKQAYFPKGSKILPNPHGTAPGCAIEENGKIMIILPGPPKEVAPMFNNYVKPFLKKYSSKIIKSKTLRLCGIGEGVMAEMASDIIKNSTNPTVAPYAKEEDTILRITAEASTEDDALKLINPVEIQLKKIFGINIYGEDDIKMEEVLGKMLTDKKFTISSAESCTGGMIAAKLVNYPGISEVFKEGAVTYSNEAKINRLGVKKTTLDKYGAVSYETAREMAEGIAKTSNTDIGISTTGIAGPGGGSTEKPVGLVYMGLYIKGRVQAKKFQYFGSRNTVRKRATMSALDWVRREILSI